MVLPRNVQPVMKYFLIASFLFCIVTLTSNSCEAFSSRTASFSRKQAFSTELPMFGDAFKGAFSNDDSLGKAKNAGLKNGPNGNDAVTFNGKKVKAVVGQKVSVVAAQARAKISYSCKKGDCGTCEITMNGRITKACQAKIPSGKCAMETFR
uniref:2Fe-2S ferredoxin-type domain-containing protein n=1 Tax=Eucampia antarctica TaxID=49252 RepID=A0A7S2S4R7_9STRA|mmetsp:Transcript_31075/g.29906  ORF Transcript_31075/g.29906 Transcript_31075/m.29906 type:complete len:152 (+) Transcript_31075:113-568(+)|eukprot:CAMPEP_0197831752 /NCGR_PEP_ID=MMETSP1437-20131217/11936_1 /TAXON_ID=49252 ORGANISM="Eucampia antarctica, Strain CCMP1452" /NCGR_SAMPLE_ID=MMETSP1437 /ASSEMBLY_ACC=CAM_ASM_001096 /LENGTH=151 /DNA_ID=CAMNT_0043434803 /DNA_START=85 /DNA_END=540 /DNA_ORIENTATION=+